MNTSDAKKCVNKIFLLGHVGLPTPVRTAWSLISLFHFWSHSSNPWGVLHCACGTRPSHSSRPLFCTGSFSLSPALQIPVAPASLVIMLCLDTYILCHNWEIIPRQRVRKIMGLTSWVSLLTGIAVWCSPLVQCWKRVCHVFCLVLWLSKTRWLSLMSVIPQQLEAKVLIFHIIDLMTSFSLSPANLFDT